MREISSCSCLTVLHGPAWVLLSKTYKPLFTPLYTTFLLEGMKPPGGNSTLFVPIFVAIFDWHCRANEGASMPLLPSRPLDIRYSINFESGGSRCQPGLRSGGGGVGKERKGKEGGAKNIDNCRYRERQTITALQGHES